MSVLVALAAAVAGAATLGLTPVMAGNNDDPTRRSSVLESGGFVDHGFAHLTTKDLRGDKLRAARCAVPGYRAAFPSKCPALSPKLAPRGGAPARALRQAGVPQGAPPALPARSPSPRPTGR